MKILENGTVLSPGAAAALAVAGVVHQRSMRSSGSAARAALRPLGFAFVDATASEMLLTKLGWPAVIEVTHPGAVGRGRSARVAPGETAAGFAAANRGVVRLVLPHYGYKNGLDAFSYGENILVLVSDAEMPSYVLTLYSADDAGNYRVDQDIEVSGLREVEEFLGKRFATFRPVTIASKLLDRMS